eukprot:1469026-Pleurochrysis_carterae.AAC.1
MGSGGQEVRPSPCEVAWNVGELATAADRSSGRDERTGCDRCSSGGGSGGSDCCCAYRRDGQDVGG